MSSRFHWQGWARPTGRRSGRPRRSRRVLHDPGSQLLPNPDSATKATSAAWVEPGSCDECSQSTFTGDPFDLEGASWGASALLIPAKSRSASSGEATARWWDPDFCLRPLPFLGHPALSHFWIRRSILRSAMRCSMNLTSHSCDKLSKDTTTHCLHAVERAPTGHRSHAEDEQLLPLTAQLSPRQIFPV